VSIKRRGLYIGLLAALTASIASANYHFVHYTAQGAPYAPVFERFAVESQPGGVVQYFIQTPPATLQFSAGDSFPALVSQIRAAADVWNSVPTSTFRFAFGGMATPDIKMSAPSVIVTFDDELPPGIVAMGGPITRADLATAPTGQDYVPIIQSSLVIGTDMRSPKESDSATGPSWSDRLFLTLVHELGHTAGLQHSWTSSVMSTEITRAMTKAHPLGADDVAGISMLYPGAGWTTKFGSISGHVTLGDQGVNLASVVAITADGEAISTLTNPDGTYELDGLPAGAYRVYVHAVPPSLPSELLQPVNLVLPTDGTQTFAAGPAFNTIFHPGDPVQVTAGQTAADVDFSVTQRDSVAIYDVQTYSYFWNEAAQAYDTSKPATFVLGDTAAPYAVAAGKGLLATNGIDPAAGLSVSVLGAPDMVGDGAIKAYPYSQGYLQFNFSLNAQKTAGPRHLVFNLNGETEILPSGVLLTTSAPPAVSGIQTNADGTVTVSGTGIGTGTTVQFDGAPAAIQQVATGAVTVVPPPAQPGASAAVIALASSGLDSSFFAPAAEPLKYSYADNSTPAIQVTPNTVAAGIDTVLDLAGTNVNFAASGLRIGFGTSDIVVRHVWLLSAQHAQVAISVSPNAAQGSTTITLLAGLQLVESPLSLQITAPTTEPRAVPSEAVPSSLAAGREVASLMILPVENVPAPTTAADFAVSTPTAGGATPVGIIAFVGGQLILSLPANLTPGQMTFNIRYHGTILAPAIVDVQVMDPAILAASDPSTGAAYDATAPVTPGRSVSLLVSSLAADIAPVDLASLAITVNGVAQTLNSVAKAASGSNRYAVQFTLSAQTQAPAGAATLPVVISSGTRTSAAFALPVSAPVAQASN